ncbi:hypothetical protein OG723_01525 [Streptomyces sp. NBC_01278]|uniref:hypothetical protein n=1 Tax=Streptomyces sp. NBC_01278 TaxID=2903809 RepID=UPI002E369B8E|nr:hypothetical protein [Streptomyces sp. NBC_01278]
MSEPSDFVARLRVEQQAPGRDEALRLDRRARRRRGMLAAGAAVLGLAAVGGWIASSTGERPTEEPYAPQALDEALWPPQWPATVRMPFRGSPSAAWADGAAGIDLPASEAVGAFTSQQVGDVLRKTREVLVESNLTPRVVLGAQPDAEVEKVLGQPGEGRSPLWYFTRFDPDEVRLQGTAIKTRGTMTYEASPAGELVVHSDYTFVYPLVKVSGGTEVVPGAEEVTRVVVRRRLDLVAGGDGRLSVRDAQWRAANDDCRAPEDGYLHPLFSKERAKAPKWPTLDPYDTGGQLAGSGGSGRECATPKQT